MSMDNLSAFFALKETDGNKKLSKPNWFYGPTNVWDLKPSFVIKHLNVAYNDQVHASAPPWMCMTQSC